MGQVHHAAEVSSLIGLRGRVRTAVEIEDSGEIEVAAPAVSFSRSSDGFANKGEHATHVSSLVGLRSIARADLALDGVNGADDAQFEGPHASTFGMLGAEPFVRAAHSGTLAYGSDTITLPFDSETDTYAFGPMRLKHRLVETIVHASYMAGVDPRLLMAIADKESSFMARARASTSTATGLFQFIDGTWLRAIRDFGARFGLDEEARLVESSEIGPTVSDPDERRRILEMRNDPFLSTLFAASMLRAEQEKLAGRLGRQISDAEVYLVHFLGPAGAQKFLAVLAEKPKTPAANLLPMAARANRPIFYAATKRKPKSLSVAQVHEKIGTSLERRLVRYRDLDFGPATAYAPTQPNGSFQQNPLAHWRL
ncbi:MAG: lytic transglycosylase domain-containing protein [Beijerinckiaceae bacterium]|nr:lytic transglycosylase domain-containing protein [Beijerinckiaceae bacterium]